MKAISLFSGCGGLDLGLEKAGFKVVLANDLSPICRDSYRINRPRTQFHLGSVSDLTPKRLRELLGDELDDIGLLAGGPPCPPFSKSRFYRKEKLRGLADPIGWETVNGYLTVLRAARPKAFILENVPGMAYKVHEDALNLIIKRASSLGYKCVWKVLNAADFGVPQMRERFFLVGMLGKTFDFPSPSHAKNPNDNSLKPWVPTGAVLKDLDTDENASDVGHFAGGSFNRELKKIPPGENYLFFTAQRGHPKPLWKWRSRYWSFLLKLSPSMPSWTIQARRSNNMGPFHWRNRILRVEEIKRLQTFPDSWHLSGKIEDQWRQVGNAVPPLLAARLARHLFLRLRENAGREMSAACKA